MMLLCKKGAHGVNSGCENVCMSLLHKALSSSHSVNQTCLALGRLSKKEFAVDFGKTNVQLTLTYAFI